MNVMHISILLFIALGASAVRAEVPSYEEFVPGLTRTQVIEVVKKSYAQYPIEERVDPRYGISSMVVTMFKQGKRFEVILEFNFRDVLSHIQVSIHGMSGDEYDAMLNDLQKRYGSPDDTRTVEKPIMTWNFERKKYTLEVYFLGEHAQLDYSYAPSR
jgi:hypothetical protein